MQDRYAGDMGDFGKFGLLSALEITGFRIGINWYKVLPPSSEYKKVVPDMDTFQSVFCMTTDDRTKQKYHGPYELLESIRAFIDSTFSPEEQKKYVRFGDKPNEVPLAIAAGYMILKQTVTHMGRLQ